MTDDDVAEGCYRFRDLEAKGIVSGRTDLARKLATLDFPKPIKIGDRQAAYLKSEVHAWLRMRAAKRDAPPVVPAPPAPKPITTRHLERTARLAADGTRRSA